MSQSPNIEIGGTFYYKLCGWHTRSDIPLTGIPQLTTSSQNGESFDIVIEMARGRSPIVESKGQAIFEHSAECSLIGINGIADFEVSGGKQIRVWPAAGTTQKEIEIFLFGPVWASLCHQRRVLPLHASAVVTNGGITAFTGHCGAGKSTAAACMNLLGHELVADDILPVSFHQNSEPGAWPYLRRLKLQNDSISRLALIPAEPVSERLDKEKYFVHPTCVGEAKWRSLKRLYLLESDPAASCIAAEQITGPEAVRVLIDQTYHFQFILRSGLLGDHLEFCTRLASKIAIYRLRRSSSIGLGKDLGLFVAAHFEGAT